MKIAIESTKVLTSIDGVGVRLWLGKTESGIPVRVWVHRVEARADENLQEFCAELLNVDDPSELKRRELRELNTIPWML